MNVHFHGSTQLHPAHTIYPVPFVVVLGEHQ